MLLDFVNGFNRRSIQVISPSWSQKSISFADLLDFNSRAALQYADAVWCGHCNGKTKQTSVRETTSDIVLFEVIRVTQKSNNTWSKNTIPITFPTRDVLLFGDRKYHVVATCHHKGSIQFGHWFTKLCLNNGTWHTLDDLNPKHRTSEPPGSMDSTVVILALIATDKLFNFINVL